MLSRAPERLNSVAFAKSSPELPHFRMPLTSGVVGFLDSSRVPYKVAGSRILVGKDSYAWVRRDARSAAGLYWPLFPAADRPSRLFWLNDLPIAASLADPRDLARLQSIL